MNFCPSCGAAAQSEQNYCRYCGYELRLRADSELSERLQRSQLAVRGLGRSSEYFMTLDGFLRVRIRSDFFVVLAGLLAAPIALLLGLSIQAVSYWFYFMVWFLLAAPIYDEFKWRRLNVLESLSFDELASRSGSAIIPWSSLRKASLRGRSLSISSNRPSARASISLEENDVPVIERALASKLGDRFRRLAPRRVPEVMSGLPFLVLSLFVACQLVLFLAAVLPFFPGEEQHYTIIVNSLRQTVSSAPLAQEFRLILLNNVQVAVGSGVPGLGTLTYFVSDYNTGRAIQVIAIQASFPPSLEVLNLFLYPHTWLEELSYSIATGAGLFYLFNWNVFSIEERSNRIKRSSIRLALSFVGVAALLALAALFEVVEPQLGAAALLLWVPLGIGVFLLRKRLSRIVNILTYR